MLLVTPSILIILFSGSRDDIYEQESPFGKAINQSVDMFKATKVDIKAHRAKSHIQGRGGCHDDESAKLQEPIRWLKKQNS
jgi:hypothetical protein